MATRNRTLSKLAKDVDASGNIKATGISADVSLGLDVYDSFSLLPMVGNDAGDQAFVTDTGRLYVHSGGGWYNTALINRTPTVASIQDSDANTTPFTLATDGTATRITITATDSDGDPLTYNATADSDFAGLATLSQDTNVFTVTPLSQDSATTESGTITFTITDGINTATPAAQTFTLDFLSALWDEVVLSIGMADSDGLDNSTFIDRSTNAHAVTLTGSPAQTAFHPYLDNWSLEIPSGTNHVQMATNAAYVLSDAFTLEAWVKTTVESCVIMTTQVGSNNDYWGINISNGYVFHNFRTPSLQTNGSASTYIADGLWHHVAMVRASGSTTVTVYVDGQSDDTFTWSTTLLQDPISFGAGLYPGFENYNFIGNISNARISDVARYTSNFTPSTEKFTSDSDTQLLVFQDNRFIDRSSVGNSFTLTGSPKISSSNPFGQGSEYAVGENKGSVLANSGYMSTSISSIGTGDFTLECWAYFTTTSGSGGDIIFDSRPDGLSTTGFAFYRRDTGHFTIFHGLGYEGSIDLNANQWYHLAVSRSSGTLKTFVNGVEDTSQSITSNMSRTSATVLAQYDGSNKMVGYVSDLNLTNGTGKYTTDFTPPTAPVGNTSANLYLPMDNAGIFDKTGNHTLTLVGDTSTSTTQTKFADTAMYFDGSGDYIDLDSPLIDGNVYTIECWYYTTTVGSNGSPFYAQGETGGSTRFWFGLVNGSTSVNRSSGPIVQLGSTELNASNTSFYSTWAHFAVTSDGSTLRLYVNGQLADSAASSATPQQTHGVIGSLGADWSTSYIANGYMENLQILNGVAKYTSNFTVPDREQGRTYQAED